MSRIGGKNTAPEKKVRSILWSLGHRFQLHVRALPGCPDIVLPDLKKAVLVHGCFWHGHKSCRRSDRPKTNGTFWDTKIDKNMRRDARVKRQLRSKGWKSLVVWQCEIKNETKLRNQLKRFTKG